MFFMCTLFWTKSPKRFKFEHEHLVMCQCSSAWLEHSPCKRKVVGSDPIIGSFCSSFRCAVYSRVCRIWQACLAAEKF